MYKANAPRIIFARPNSWATTHCACAVDSAVPSTLPKGVISGSWQKTPDLFQTPLPDGHEVAFHPASAWGPVVLNAPAQELLKTYRQPHDLISPSAQTLAQLGLLQPLTLPAPELPLNTRPHTLTAWLHLTNDCNLSCTYCFVRKNDETMSPEVGLAAVDAVFRSARADGFSAVKLKYAGGEPTLNFSLIRALHTRAINLSQNYGIELQEVILSNGISLTADMLDFIQTKDIILSISLDGLDEGHDSQRVFANGRGSSQHVRRGIQRALEHGISPHLSITVTRHNVDELPRVVSFALEHELYFNLNFYLEHTPWTSHQDLQADNKRLIAGLRQALAVIESNLPAYNVFTSLLDRTNLAGAHNRACGAGDSYMVIDHHGQVARCQMEMHKPVTDIWSTQPLADIRLYEPGADGPSFLEVEEKSSCNTCPWRYVCGGGCTMMTYRLHGRSDMPSPYCDVYKAILPEIVRLEGLRLLKWHNVN